MKDTKKEWEDFAEKLKNMYAESMKILDECGGEIVIQKKKGQIRLFKTIKKQMKQM